MTRPIPRTWRSSTRSGATDHRAPTGFRDGLAASGSWSLHVREVGHGAGGCVTRCTSMISRPRPTIRSTSPGRAAWSGNSARRVVVSGHVVTWQSSNCARSVLPAWPLKVISYIGDRTGIMPRNWWLTLAIRVPDGEVRVVTRYWVIRLDAPAAAGPRRAVGTSEARQSAPAAVRPPSRLCGPGSSLPPESMLRGEAPCGSCDPRIARASTRPGGHDVNTVVLILPPCVISFHPPGLALCSS